MFCTPFQTKDSRENCHAHDDVIKWKHLPHYWPFVWAIHRPPVNSPHKGQWRGYLMFSLICTWRNGWVNNRKAGDLRRHRAHYDVIIMAISCCPWRHRGFWLWQTTMLAWSEHAGQLAAGGVASIWRSWVRSPPGPRLFIGSFVCLYAFPCAGASIYIYIYISPAPGRSSKLTHTRVEIDTCAFQTGCQLSSAASGMSLELYIWHDFGGMKRTCWTTGSWRTCLSLEVVSSIPAGSTITYRFLCGLICVSLCQSIKIQPKIHIHRTYLQVPTYNMMYIIDNMI